MLRSTLLFSAFLMWFTAIAPAKELEGVRAPAAGPCPSVDEAIAKMTVPDGYAVRCFASEPMIINPVAMTWDHRGRLWVVELYEYPSGAAHPNEYSKTATDEEFRPVIPHGADSPRDRVIILEDTDNDGKADKRTVFAEGLNLATAILCGHGGVYVGQAPNLFFFRDNDGDDKADEYKTVLTGFGLEDRHELLNSFTWGPDGWMYFTHGVFTHSKVRRPEQKPEEGFTLNAGVFRVKLSSENGSPRADDYEVYADGTSNPWGVDFDARGNAFVEACVIDHFFHMAPGGIYARQGGAPENPYAYELLPSIVPKDHPRHFRAAYAGITIYQGGIYPEDTHGHAFFGNIHDNAIHEEAMDPVGATFKARPVRDFLRANDGWFRPVSIQTGPDGFLWVMDWCDKYPCYQNAQANPEGVDREKGRIWRVCYTGSGAGKELAGKSRHPLVSGIDSMNQKGLGAAISSENSWLRKESLRVVRESFAENPLDLTAMLASIQRDRWEAFPLTFAGLLDTIAGQTGTNDTFEGMARQNNEVFRAFAAREIGNDREVRRVVLAGAPVGPFRVSVGAVLETLVKDPSPMVRYETAASLRRLYSGSLTSSATPTTGNPSVLWDAFHGLIQTSAADADATLSAMIWNSVETLVANEPADYFAKIGALFPTTKPLSLTLTNKSARRIIDTRKPENVDLLLTFLDQLKDHPDLTAAALEGMLKAQEAGALMPASADPAPFFALWQNSPSEKVRTLSGRLATLWGDPNAVAALMGTVLNPDADNAQRLEAIRTVRRLKSDTARAGIRKLLGTKTPDNLSAEAIRAAGELGGLDLANEILAAWEGYSPALKTTAAEVFVTRQDWAKRFLDAVEGKWVASGKINPAGIPVSVRRSFAQNPELKDRATQLLGAWNESGDDIKALIAAKRQACIEGEPDMALGKVLFTATCATCHKFFGGGQEAGPELIGSGRSNLDAILANVIDPNQIIGNGYQNFLITTKDGRTLAGRIIEDTPTQVTLLGIGGSREVVPVADIAKKEDTGLSLMPMGFGSLPDDQFRSLIWYLLAPPEEGPLTPEKKAALIKGAETETPPAAVGTVEKEFPKIDWESVSLWNPDWKVTAPEFEGTPKKLVEFEGRKNVLQLHPFPDRKSSSMLSRKFTLPATGQPSLEFDVAAQGDHDWELVVRVNGQEMRRRIINSEGGRWQHQTLDLIPWRGKPVEVQLENHANGWSWEFSYWSDLKFRP